MSAAGPPQGWEVVIGLETHAQLSTDSKIFSGAPTRFGAPPKEGFTIAPALYQYTAIDDCSRWKVMGLYPRRSATSTLSFLDRLLEEMPFPIQRIQTDRGLEFFAEAVQSRLMEWGIKFRPIKPRSPHLNGKVERTQRADLEEFWATADPKLVDLQRRLDEWQHFWNWHRPHTALGGRSPIDRVCELMAITPAAEAVDAAYDPAKERIRVATYVTDKTVARVK